MDLYGYEAFIAAPSGVDMLRAPAIPWLLQNPTWLHRTTMRLIGQVKPNGKVCSVNITPAEINLPGVVPVLTEAARNTPGLVFELVEGTSVLGPMGKKVGVLHPWLDDMCPNDYPLGRLGELEQYFREYGGGGKTDWAELDLELILAYGEVVSGQGLPFVVEKVPNDKERLRLIGAWQKAGLAPSLLKVQGYCWSMPALTPRETNWIRGQEVDQVQ